MVNKLYFTRATGDQDLLAPCLRGELEKQALTAQAFTPTPIGQDTPVPPSPQ